MKNIKRDTMNYQIFFRTGLAGMIFFSMLVVLASLFAGCSDDNDPSGAAYFTIEDNPTGFTAEIAGGTKSYVVRSNRPWRIVTEGEGTWAKVFPAEGKDDGIFKLTVAENADFAARVLNFAFVVDNAEQPVLFRIEQKANVRNITVANKNVAVLSAGGAVGIDVKANVAWTYTLSDASWLTQPEVSASKIAFVAAKNAGDERSATVLIQSAEFPELNQTVVITQAATSSILLKEDFSWLNYGVAVPYKTDNETRMDLWKEEEKNRGWTSTPVAISSNQPMVYARPGFIKLGKTGVGGDLIAPKLPIEGTVNLKVTFKAAAYISAGGAVDDKILKVFALGAGTTSVPQFSIENIPNSEAQDKAGVVNDIWADDRAYSFTITGATAETQVKFLGGDYNLTGVGQGKNRIFMDDIKIEIID